jgi:chromosome partitioning protein
MATVVSFINFKGGVGKTTLCVETAAALAGPRFGERVLVIDLDPQTNATFTLMTETAWENQAAEHGTLRDFFEQCLAEETPDLRPLIVRQPVRGTSALDKLDLVPSHIELFGMDLRLATKYGHENLRAKSFLRSAIGTIKDDYDWVFIDCPPNLYLATQNGLFASDHYLIIALAEYLSTLGIAHIQHSIEQIFAEANRTLAGFGAPSVSAPPPAGIIFNRVRTLGGGTHSQEDIIQRIESRYPGMVFQTKVPQSDKIPQRAETKIPIAVSGYAADRPYEERLSDLAGEFYDRLTRPAAV